MRKLIIIVLALIGISITTSAVTKNKMLKAAYVDITGSTLNSIPKEGVESCNIVIFAFADPKKNKMTENELHAIKKILQMEAPGTKNFLSIGGEHAKPEELPEPKIAIDNITGQMNHVNNCLKGWNIEGVKINGVDLDLENAISSDIISELAEGFKNNGWEVSIAPQVLSTDYSPIDPSNPSNLGLASGYIEPKKNCNQYHKAIKGGHVDYIMLQAYNSWDVTVKEEDKEYHQTNVEFLKLIGKAMNNSDLFKVHSPKILIGTPANQSAGTYTIFNPKNWAPDEDGKIHYEYDQEEILAELNNAIDEMKHSRDYDKVSGVMVWSLNNDYSPHAFGDASATPGAFCHAIFDAKKMENFNFRLSCINHAQHGWNTATITLVVDEADHVFRNKEGNNIPPGHYALWGGVGAHAKDKRVIVDPRFNSFFKDGKKSFDAKLIINVYTAAGGSDYPEYRSFKGGYTFERDKIYELNIDADAGLRKDGTKYNGGPNHEVARTATMMCDGQVVQPTF